MGDPDADADNPVLKEEQDAQVIVSRVALKFNKFYHILTVYDILSFLLSRCNFFYIFFTSNW